MHARTSTITGATDIDGGVALVRDEVLPQLQQQKGFRGISVSADRSSGLVTVLSVWDSEADLDASESMADKARNDAVRVMGGQVHVERYEQPVLEMGESRPQPGAKLFIRPIKMDPARVDEHLEFFRQTVLPEIKSTPGFLGVRTLIDRRTGEGRVGSLWADEDARQGAIERAEQRRAAVEARGIELGDDMKLEVLLVST
jgi:heme-degrading monooxygenase HmoA